MNNALNSIQPSVTLAIGARARQLAAEGQSVCNFVAGEPDFDTPEAAKEGAIVALRAGETKYTPIAGIGALCKSIAAKLERDNGLRHSPAQVIVSCGAKHSLANVFLALCNPGDEVIIPAPYWLSYPEMVRIAGGVPVFVSGDDAHALKISPAQLEAAITPRTLALVLNSPSNPSGTVYTAEELKALADVCVRHGLYIVADEIYERMVYDGTRHVSVGSLSPEIFERTITVNGLSKAYAMTGWRIGYAAGPADVIRAMCTVQSHTASAPTTFAQFGGLEALSACDADVDAMVRAFAQRRERMYELLQGIRGLSCVKPMGAFYMFPNIGAFGLDSKTFAERLIDEQHVATVPGVSFGADDHIRLSYACSLEEVVEGVARIKRFIEGL